MTLDTCAAHRGDKSTDRSTNLTRDDAAKRADTVIEVDTYQIVLDLTDGKGQPSPITFRSTTTVTFKAKPGEQTFIDMAPGPSGRVHTATLNGVTLDVSAYNGSQGITLTDLADNNSVEVEADCTYSHDGEGLYRFEDPSEGEVYLYSQFEPAAAKRMFACFDQPDLKARFDLTVVAPEHWHVISNTSADVRNTAHTKVHKFAATSRISTYLVALIAGPYMSWDDSYTDERGTIPLRIFCRKSLQEFMDAERLFDLTKRGFGFYHRTFAVTYPFGKYDQVFCPAFNHEGMENVAAVTFTEDYVFRGHFTRYQFARRAEALVHEMAHMWFGDLVTMKWWDDLWLNESFATWAANLCLAEATEFREAWSTFANVEKPKAYRQDQLPSTHPVADDVPNLDLVQSNFDFITYIKGASALKQLVAYIGRDRFLAGLRDYFNTHAFANAELDDLLTALQQKSPDRDVRGWANQWLKTTGLNTLRADFDIDAADKVTGFAVTQSRAEPGSGATRIHRLRIGIYDGYSAKLTRVHQCQIDVAGARTEVPELQGFPRGNLILVNDDDDTYCSLRLDPRSLAAALIHVGDIADSLPRAQVWSTIWEMTRNSEFKACDFVSLVGSRVHTETQIAVLHNLLSQVQTALTRYTEPTWSNQYGWPVFADRLLELACGSKPGSDEQLAYVNGLGADRVKERQRCCVLSKRHTEVLSALLDTDNPAQRGLPGLRIDTDLRWRIVIALATAGFGDSERLIDTEYQRDRTEQGRLNAEQARAARPLADTKQKVWRRVLEDKDISNSDARAIVAGFAAPGQAELLAPYMSRYFDSIVALWNNRPQAVATTIATGLYPTWEISQAGIDAADAFLCRDMPPPLRRLIREAQAEVIRALQARAFDAKS